MKMCMIDNIIVCTGHFLNIPFVSRVFNMQQQNSISLVLQCVFLILTIESSSCFEDSLIFDESLNSLDQHDPKLINFIRDKVLIPPPIGEEIRLPEKGFYKSHEQCIKGQHGQSILVETMHNSSPNGFFIEAGAFNGFDQSNSLLLELKLNWTGLLVEPNPEMREEIIKLKRKAWLLPACLSTKTTPETVTFDMSGIIGGIRNLDSSSPDHKAIGDRLSFKTGQRAPRVDRPVQCFPLYSVLMAMGNPKVDYFSLDIEGAELQVLRTIPFDELSISVLGIEIAHAGKVFPGSKMEIRNLLKDRGYRFYSRIAMDEFFVRKDEFRDDF